jgi:hypothetical protein
VVRGTIFNDFEVRQNISQYFMVRKVKMFGKQCSRLSLEETTTNRNVNNGKLKDNSNEELFMNLSAVIECIKSIKIKNSEVIEFLKGCLLMVLSTWLALKLVFFSLIYTKN